jgi:hypothetical protein
MLWVPILLTSKSASIRATRFRVEMILDPFCGPAGSLLYRVTFFRRISTLVVRLIVQVIGF